LTEAEVGALARAVPVLPEAILEQIGVEAHGPPGQELALPGLDRRRGRMGATGGASDRHHAQKQVAQAKANEVKHRPAF
jgi:hypothetical protein